LKLDQQLGNSTVVIDFRGDSAAASLKPNLSIRCK